MRNKGEFRREKKNLKPEFALPDSDAQFAFIAGYSEGGFPYGTTWDELLEDAFAAEETMSGRRKLDASKAFRDWAPDLESWPSSWMGVKEDLEYGRELLPYFEDFLQELYDEGLSRKTFVQYRDNLWLLGGSIITRVSNYEEYDLDPLEKLYDSVINDGILPDHHDQMNEAELNAFARMCRRFEKFLHQHYGELF